METLTFGILGPLEVRQGPRVLSLGGRRQRAVLAALVIEANRVVLVDRLIDAVWEEHAPATAKGTLQTYIGRLRRVLPATPSTGPVLRTEGTGYLLRVEPEAIDAQAFEKLAGLGRDALGAGQADTAAAVFSDALALWRGPALADFIFDAFATAEAGRLEELRLSVIENRIDAALALSRHTALVGELEHLVATYPLRERLRGQLMLALYRSGRQAEALRTYQAGRRLLADELGIEPGPALKALETAVLLQDAGLDWTPPEPQPPTPSANQQIGGELVRSPDGTESPAGGATVRSETITFLAVCVGECERLWSEQPHQAGGALARYEAIVADVSARHGGTVTADREGDHLTVVFRQAGAAATAAAELQRAMFNEPWPTGTVLRSAAALHTGEAVIYDGRYHGLTINRVMVLRSLAHPGQILCTRATADMIGDQLPEGTFLEQLGICRLSELHHPEPVWQLGHRDLPAVFPPLPSPESPPTNLPAALTSFVGREPEIAEIRKRLDTGRLVTIVGPGGVGKTRLALQVAAELSTAHADGTWFVDLAPQTDPTQVVAAIATALGVSEQPGRPLADTVLAHLRPRHLLVVLDNCEHVLDGCTPLLNTLLQAAPELRVLATSRERLRIAGEVIWTAPPLRTPEPDGVRSMTELEGYEATRLFLDRAAAAQPQVGFTDSEARIIARICHRLDGLPLAVELAAARVAMLTTAEILDRLEDRFRLLRSGLQEATARHATLRTTLDWSYDLLDEDEQILLRRLAVFSGGFTLTAAATVGAGPLLKEDDVFDLLDSLVSRSLVVREATNNGSRFRLLETVRCYAAERLEQTGEAADVTFRHLEFYLALAEQLEPETFGASPEPALDRLEAEHDNLRAALNRILNEPTRRRNALRLAHALFPLWEFREHRAEGRAVMEALLSAAGTDDAMESAVARRAGNLALTDGDEQSAERHWRQALDRARRVGDARHLGRALTSVARAVRSAGDFDAARALLEEGRAAAQSAGDDLFVDDALIRLGWLAYDQSRYPEARRDAEMCCAREGGSWLNATRAFDILGWVACDQGDYAEARRCFERASEISRAVGDQHCQAEALDGLGSVAAAEGRWEDARFAWEAATVLLRQGPPLILVGPLGGLAVLASLQGDHETARAFLEEELTAAGRRNDPADAARTLLRLGHAAQARDDQTDAVSRYRQLLDLAQRIGMPRHVAGALDGLAMSLEPGESAVTMAATADRLRHSVGAVLPVPGRDHLQEWLTAAREKLGGRRFDAAWTAGQRADVGASLAAALAVGN